jgi:hypothetical protein
MPKSMTRHQKAIAFFMKHAGYARKPGESVAQAMRHTATRLAKAEQYAIDHGWSVEWQNDPESYQMGDAEDTPPNEVLWAALRDEDGNVLASLGGIGDPSREYGRVVEAELALEAMSK